MARLPQQACLAACNTDTSGAAGGRAAACCVWQGLPVRVCTLAAPPGRCGSMARWGGGEAAHGPPRQVRRGDPLPWRQAIQAPHSCVTRLAWSITTCCLVTPPPPARPAARCLPSCARLHAPAAPQPVATLTWCSWSWRRPSCLRALSGPRNWWWTTPTQSARRRSWWPASTGGWAGGGVGAWEGGWGDAVRAARRARAALRTCTQQRAPLGCVCRRRGAEARGKAWRVQGPAQLLQLPPHVPRAMRRAPHPVRFSGSHRRPHQCRVPPRPTHPHAQPPTLLPTRFPAQAP